MLFLILDPLEVNFEMILLTKIVPIVMLYQAHFKNPKKFICKFSTAIFIYIYYSKNYYSSFRYVPEQYDLQKYS